MVKNGLAKSNGKGSMELAAFKIFDKKGEKEFNYQTFKRVMKAELHIDIPNWRTKQARLALGASTRLSSTDARDTVTP